MGLSEYWKKRDFKETAEPSGRKKAGKKAAPRSSKTTRSFVIQKHDASHLHYDFRLELDGVLKSWAVPKGPSLDPKQKRLAVQVEDHPIDYASFEGNIPAGEYGGGDVIVWDRGEWMSEKPPQASIKAGRLEFELKGEKLNGRWVLIRTGRQSSKPQWLLIKRTDEAARPESKFNVVEEMPESVKTGARLPRDGGGKATKKAAKSAKKTKTTKVKKKASGKFPGFIKPQLAKLEDSPPSGENWVHELKFDGYRAVTTLEKGKVKIFTRSGLDWTAKYTALAQAMKKIRAQNAVLDGEIVAIDKDGRSNFSGLQLALSNGRDKSLVYFIFDLLWLNGEDLRELPLLERKEMLEKLLRPLKADAIRISEHWQEDGAAMLKAACKLDMEGIISKRTDAEYESTRSGTWIKSKCGKGQEFVIGGFTEPQGSRSGFGALLLGAKDENGDFRYVGRVGTGFDGKMLTDLKSKLKKRIQEDSPFEVASPKGREITFVKPDLVVQVNFGEWTSDKVLRHATFEGMREDKKAGSVVIETAKATPVKGSKGKASKSVKALKKKKSAYPMLTHPDKLLYPKAGFTKERLAEYYDNISKWILPHVENRPLSLVRCPDGEGGECFFQKKLGNHKGINLITKKQKGMKGKTEEIVSLKKKEGLTELVQMGVLEIHAWGCQADDIKRPNLIVFDLDPEESVKWAAVKKTAFVLRDLLEQMNLKSFVSTTGGKGLHIRVPIVPEHDFDQIKAFSLAVVRHLEKEHPDQYTTQILKSKRHGRIFLDYLRNGYGATAIVPYSLRAKPNATVSVPITWDELRTLKGAGVFTLVDVERRLFRGKDPWRGYFKLRQKLALR